MHTRSQSAGHRVGTARPRKNDRGPFLVPPTSGDTQPSRHTTKAWSVCEAAYTTKRLRDSSTRWFRLTGGCPAACLRMLGYLRFRLDLVQAEETVVIRAGDDAVDAVVHEEHLQSEREGARKKYGQNNRGWGNNTRARTRWRERPHTGHANTRTELDQPHEKTLILASY